MTIDKSALLTHLDYSMWADKRLLEACAALSAEEQERNLGVSHGGVAGTLRHLYYAERVWLNRLRGEQHPFQDPSPEPGVAELTQKWPEVWDGFRQWLERLPDADLEGELHSRRTNGEEFRMARWKVLLHVVNHSTLHRGQVMGMLRQLGKQPPGTDILSFYLLP